ncbi:putative inhibitor of apoptosis [Thrips palmi]|uniref:Inhibitor of apoptosis n=1 Tax=Thrips palmi TaxID=161013 RepID=A0A6P8Z7S1_THRPL|nr:putative inhibitor of apoptosis [Thrips palmi]
MEPTLETRNANLQPGQTRTVTNSYSDSGFGNDGAGIQVMQSQDQPERPALENNSAMNTTGDASALGNGSGDGVTRIDYGYDEADISETPFSPETESHLTETAPAIPSHVINERRGIYDAFEVKNNLVPFMQPIHPRYCTLDRRHETLNRWPSGAPVTADALAESGFFYAGYRDIVLCFHCGISLSCWTEGDVVDQEHAAYSPYCAFINRTRGTTYVEDVQKKLLSEQEVPNHFKSYIKKHLTTQTSDEETKLDARRNVDRGFCKICFEREANVVVLPCAHFYTCAQCLPGHSKCGVCRAKVDFTLRVFV